MPHPSRNLRDAACDFAMAVECGGDETAAWDRLRKAALRYAESEQNVGRPAQPCRCTHNKYAHSKGRGFCRVESCDCMKWEAA